MRLKPQTRDKFKVFEMFILDGELKDIKSLRYKFNYIVSILGGDKGYTVKYNPLSEGVSEGKAQGNS